jgi:NTP pyrophosphatase (non-canonical NTP hydrolase)
MDPTNKADLVVLLRTMRQPAMAGYAEFVRERMAPNSLQMNQMGFGLGLTGEAGEVADMIKKEHLHKKVQDLPGLRKEMGDVIWYWFALCIVYGLDPMEVIAENVEKLTARANDAAYAAANPNVPSNARSND